MNTCLFILTIGKEPDFIYHTQAIDTFNATNSTCSAHTEHLHTLRQAKKRFRQNETDLIIVDIDNQDSEELLLAVAKYVRQGIKNLKIPIIGISTSAYLISDTGLLYKTGVNDIYNLNNSSPEHLQQKIIQLLSSVAAHKDSLIESINKIQLLMLINQFTHHRESLSDLIDEFSRALSVFCASSISLTINQINNEWDIRTVHNNTSLQSDMLPHLQTSGLATIIEKAFSERTPQIELRLPSQLASELNTATDCNFGCYLIFPLTVYNKTASIIICFIEQKNLSKVSVQHVNIMKETAEQLRILLERRVAENQFKAQYQRLKATLTELETTKDQLIHSEKMASVGNIAAGIAHEINNPLAYVLSNFSSMNEYVGTLLKMLELHDNFMKSIDSDSHPKIKQLQDDIISFQNNSDLEFIFDDIKAVVNDSKNGLLRVRDIINDLSSFSRKQTLEQDTFDLSELIQETLRLLKFNLGDRIILTTDITIDYDIQAHKGFLQQILTNLIRNSAQALQENLSVDRPGNIQISANSNQQNIIIKVRDNGPGISEKHQKRIFEPFFTTKEVGKGTGLGLSVTYNLAKKMKGDLSVKSLPGEFTEFTLLLPATPA